MDKLSFSQKQKEVWRNTIKAKHRWNVSLGATRSGKTFLDYFKIPYRIRSAPDNGLILLLGNTKGTLERNILEPMRHIWSSGLVGGIGSDNRVQLFGRECYALGADKVNQVSKLQGAGLAYCYGDEITTWHEDIFQMLKSRLDKPGACFDGTCNPEGPNHWFKAFLEGGSDLYQMAFTIDDNPYLDPVFVKNLKQEYAGTVYYDRFILGKWALAEGLIYPMFDEKKHMIRCEGREYTQWYISCDYGTLNPFSMGLWGKCGAVWHRVKEYYHNGREKQALKTDEEYYQELCALAGDRYIRSVIVDPSAASFITCIKRHGKYNVDGAKNDVVNGIRKVAACLQAGSILFDESCKNTKREFQAYAWDEKAQEDKPIKENDHAMDDIRYFVNTIVRPDSAGWGFGNGRI